ncbi:Golgi resident protein GCP60-like isoform X2 [Ruditapes philippinarum]|uniref:Golgi resident protein GCP60-like isoform X2 n=1 Tax=Ruditapes philippinarum TaxID=129788 RepID=UPI00295B671E|nr:Golgi resident protein GCP60-like isoform X2 [Ruditapes philippinarum]
MADTLPKEMGSLQINESSDSKCEVNNTSTDHEDWGFPLNDLYKMALHFYKDQDGKGLHLSYRDKLRMVALTKQASHGKYTADASPAVGFLDVVGNDRKQMWMSLGDMSKDGAMGEFVKMLDKLCPQFKPHIQAQKAEIEEQERKRKEEEEQKKEEEAEKERKLLEDEAQRQLQLEKQRQLEQEKQIRAALNQQTAQQFKQYAEQQCPGNIKQQEELIGQLQEQHFQQYMQQVYQQQLLHQQQQYQQLQAMQAAQKGEQAETNPPQTNGQAPPSNIQTTITATPLLQNGPLPPPVKTENSENNTDDTKEAEEEDDLPPIAAASMWTRKDVKEFKESLKKDKDSVIKVGSGETVTVRVPTHEDGSCLFWEFATDYYDIGFGVFFEWTIAPSNTVSVHVSESSDEEELEEEEGKANDVEKGGDKRDDRPPVDEIIPVYRRDCHEEVYCGSHAYPGRGVYLLKFDNSYSLWRSKTLYYRVYYSR